MVSRDQSQDRTALVLYGTETGTSQDVAEEVGRCLERLHFFTEITDLDNVRHQALADETLVVFVVATTGQGDFPSNSKKFWTSLLRKKLTSTTLTGVEYALVGLGDSSYPKFNWAARKLEKRLDQLGASAILESCEADEQGEESTDGAFLSWLKEFRAVLLERFPLPSDVEPVSDKVSLPARFSVALEEASNSNNNAANGHVNGTVSGRDHDEPFPVVLESNERLTPTDHWQDVRLISLQAEDHMDYLPGDAISIMPRNMPVDVDTLITRMQWEDVAERYVKIINCRRIQQQRHFPSIIDALGNKKMTIKDLLTEHFDINAIPRRSFFGAIAKYTNDEMHKERLLEFTDAQYLDEYYDYATRPRRSILEILQEFDTVQIPWQDITNVFPTIRPRHFSIASAASTNQTALGSRFELLVAIVKYRTVIKRTREGVCTRYLAQLPVGSRIHVALKKEGRLVTRDQLKHQQHLLIGAGTGLAPLRALIHEKSSLGTTVAPTFMIFGARNEDADYFFHSEWKDLIDKGARLQVITAFSRDQKAKIYVQDKIRDHNREVARILHDDNSCVVICGASGQMPKAVRQALVDSLSAETNTKGINGDAQEMSIKEAEEHLNYLEKVGRFKQETWS